MAYTKTVWTDRVVQYANRYKDQNNVVYTFTRDSGEVVEEGTPVQASLMNKLEQGVEDAHTALDTKAPLASPALTGTPTAPTNATPTNDTTQIATNAFVQSRSKLIPLEYKTTSFTLDITLAGSHVWCDSTSTITVTIPTNATVAFPVGTDLFIGRANTGAVTLSASSGVSLLSSESKKSIYKQYEGASLLKIGTDTWVLYGSLTT